MRIKFISRTTFIIGSIECHVRWWMEMREYNSVLIGNWRVLFYVYTDSKHICLDINSTQKMLIYAIAFFWTYNPNVAKLRGFVKNAQKMTRKVKETW